MGSLQPVACQAIVFRSKDVVMWRTLEDKVEISQMGRAVVAERMSSECSQRGLREIICKNYIYIPVGGHRPLSRCDTNHRYVCISVLFQR